MKCPRCQAENREGVRFCEDCGASLAVICPSCGAELTPGKRFCGSCGASIAGAIQPEARFSSPQTYTPRHLAERIINSKAALEGERKQVTVLFADLKGSMELLADRDPEEARRILDPVLELMMQAVHRYEGTVNQIMGDGIMALFGAPVAHEDHAVRACYAALDMQAAIRRYTEEVRRTHGVAVQIRVGLNSGEVVVRAIGSDLRMDYTAVGQTTHLAARMEQLASPERTLVTADTVRLAEGYVTVAPLGPVPVKGVETSIEVYELTGAEPIRSRLHAAAARGLTRFVGRDPEIDQLRRALELAGAGHGQLVAVAGEAGVGKSRLFYEFTHSRHVQGWLILESGSVSYGKATAYLPILHLLKDYFKIQDGDTHREIRDKVIGRVLGLDRSLENLLPPLLFLLDVPVDDPRWSTLDPPHRRQRILDAVRRLLLRESAVQPVLIVSEDLHWIDAETKALLDGLVESLPAARLLLLVNYRPEHEHAWIGKPYYTQFRLDPLGVESAERLLEALLGVDDSLDPLKRILIERTGGNPFFLEECVRHLVETRILGGQRGAYRLATPLGGLPVPHSVQALLAARIDRLPLEHKRVLQAASALGKDFPLVLLKEIVDVPEDELNHSLSQLQAGELLYEAQLYPEIEYAFKHALTLDVAYGSLVRGRRRELDARTVSAIESRPDRSARQLDRLAYHAFRGEVWTKALDYCREASTRALARSAFSEALQYVDQSLEALSKLPAMPEHAALELELLTQRGAALRALHGYAASDVERVHVKARELRRHLGDTPGRFAIEWQQMQFFLVRADLQTASELSAGLLDAAHRRQERTLLIDAHLANGMTLFHRGHFPAARDHFDRGLALCCPESGGLHLLTHGQDPQVFLLCYLAWTLSFLGYPDQARARVETAVELARAKAHSFSHVSALTFAARVFQCRRDLDRVRTAAGALISAAGERGFSYYEALGLIHEGWARVLMDGDPSGHRQLIEGYTALEKTGTVLGLRGALVQLAEASQRLGRCDTAAQAVQQAERLVRGTLCWDAELARIRAELAASDADAEPGTIEALYAQALETARRQGARWLELRAALSHVRAAGSRGHEERARVRELAKTFSEGFETSELREAQGQLES